MSKKIINITLKKLVYIPPKNELVNTNECLIGPDSDDSSDGEQDQTSGFTIDMIPETVKLVPTPKLEIKLLAHDDLILYKLLAELSPEWNEIIGSYPSFEKIAMEIQREINASEHGSRFVYPMPHNLIFNAFKQTPFPPKVVILGQDPYHSNENEAMGLSFSVPTGVSVPPSLRNIFGELSVDIPTFKNNKDNGDLTKWAQSGVLLLNTALTVLAKKPASHLSIWSDFINHVLWEISTRSPTKMVYMLWGEPAKKRLQFISSEDGHLILQCVHPSPLSAHRGWFGNKHFSKCNEFLSANEQEEIDWNLV
jgi:uracil-DNA glycosylase